MQRTLTARYETRELAEAARQELIAIGMDAANVTVDDPLEKPGMFDHLAKALAPDRAADTSGGSYRLRAQVPAERARQAALVLGKPAPDAGPREQVFEFPETREELMAEKRPYVREEVVLRREEREDVADIHDTLRHTEVEIEEIPAAQARPPEDPHTEEPLRFGLRTRPE